MIRFARSIFNKKIGRGVITRYRQWTEDNL